MIHEFCVKNVLSFKDKQFFSFEANIHDEHYAAHYFIPTEDPNIKLLKMLMFYGANASGKTNFLKAVHIFKDIVLASPKNKTTEIDIYPFLLDEQSKNEDSEFVLSFFAEGKRYLYELNVNKNYISHEVLFHFEQGEKEIIYSRYFDKEADISKIEFGNKITNADDKMALKVSTIKNATVLAIYNKLNIKIQDLDRVLSWFSKDLMGMINPKIDLKLWASRQIENNKDSKNFVLDILRRADFNISNFNIDTQQIPIDNDLADAIKNATNISDEEKQNILDAGMKKIEISFFHQTAAGNYELPYKSQSEGTKRYYGLAAILYILLNDHKILPIDELENSLHPDLFDLFLRIFLLQSKNSQIIFTTHSRELLDADYIRTDAVWFAQKNNFGATEIYSAADYDVERKDLYRFYKIGKFKATPDVGSIILPENKPENTNG